MARIANSLLFRIAALFLLGLVALQIAILLAVAWPDGRPGMVRLIDPADVREIAEAVERAPPSQRRLIAGAVSMGAVSVELLPGFPEESADMRAAPWLEARFRRAAPELGNRTIRVQAREGGILSWAHRPDDGRRGPARLLVALNDGQVLAIERAPLVLQILVSRYLAVALVVAAILAASLAILLWQVVRPVQRLAAATDAFREGMDAPDVEVRGAYELRALAMAFNAMKHRIGGLVAERTQMLAAIAHDLRTYLTRLRLRAEYIEDGPQRARAVRDIEEMGQLLEDILTFARTEARADQGAQMVDARAEALAYVRIRREAGDDVAAATDDAPLYCRCPPLEFRRILANLIDNAVRYGARARLVLRAEDGFGVLTVNDDGPGVPVALMARLTEPFERLEPSRGRHSGGSGLGLSIVKALAESQGGRLELDNDATGGLRATVRLPLI